MKIREIKNINEEVIFSYDEHDERWILREQVLSGINLEKANLQGILWEDVNLHRANLREADFYWAFLFMSDLSETNCEGAKFQGANLKEVDFTGANLKNANFGKSNLGGSADVSGTNFTDANLDGAQFDATRYDDKTIFPKNFNPEKNGLVCIKSK
ncbi:MAG: pentapeptide repeat-containing protein [Pyrinomonadaceae bacterium]|nr:pentapeptide repeat-containing protein [Pyrinomonadaceae bacterium]